MLFHDLSCHFTSCYSLSNEAKRMAILGTIPVATAPRPLYRPRKVSRATICLPVAKKPRGFICGGCQSLETLLLSLVDTHALPVRPRELHADLDGVKGVAVGC